MDKQGFSERLREGAARLGVVVGGELAPGLQRLSDELLRWNRRVNLTAITDPDEVLEKHLLDSLALVPAIPTSAQSLMDLGTGAGFPGLPVALARPELRLTLVDAVAKKVGFVKHAAALLGLKGVRAVHCHASGDPAKEGLAPADVLVCRAFLEPAAWLRLARPYLSVGGQAIAMVGRLDEELLRGVAGQAGWELVELRSYQLPFSGAERGLARFIPRAAP